MASHHRNRLDCLYTPAQFPLRGSGNKQYWRATQNTQPENRCCCYGCLVYSCYGSPNAGSLHCCSRNHRAGRNRLSRSYYRINDFLKNPKRPKSFILVSTHPAWEPVAARLRRVSRSFHKHWYQSRLICFIVLRTGIAPMYRVFHVTAFDRVVVDIILVPTRPAWELVAARLRRVSRPFHKHWYQSRLICFIVLRTGIAPMYRVFHVTAFDWVVVDIFDFLP
ncbi:Uncharacterised protein [Candidatus Venteria ishoeyi]|uniref:Uncharacterized protein n=1 Tax=Candidatus Venteria ishoeyi TaxID=1899563 RepID=A0A1H6F885_9GAMM|nr:Uncharacterised protein [Candidatus Venteria ishoeyi]